MDMKKIWTFTGKHSVVLIPSLTALLYFWGITAYNVYLDKLRISSEFYETPSPEVILVLGGTIAWVTAAIIVVFWFSLLNIVTQLRKGKEPLSIEVLLPKGMRKPVIARMEWLKALRGPLIAWLLLLAFVALPEIAGSVMSFNRPSTDVGSILKSQQEARVVKSLTLVPDSKITTKYEGLLYLKKSDSQYILTNRPKDNEPRLIFILSENEVKELVLTSE